MTNEPNRLDSVRLSTSVAVPKNFKPPVFVRTNLSRDIDVVRWLHIETDRKNRDARFVLKMLTTGGMTVNDLIVEGLIILQSADPQ